MIRRHVQCILDPSARHAKDVSMRLAVAVVPGLATAGPQLLGGPFPREPIQIAIDRPEADPGQAFANDLIQLGSGRMRSTLAQFIQYHFALLGIPSGRVGVR
jgi:hypothetical protein